MPSELDLDAIRAWGRDSLWNANGPGPALTAAEYRHVMCSYDVRLPTNSVRSSMLALCDEVESLRERVAVLTAERDAAYHTIDEQAQAAYTRGWSDALRIARNRVQEALTSPSLGDYEFRKGWTVQAASAVERCLDGFGGAPEPLVTLEDAVSIGLRAAESAEEALEAVTGERDKLTEALRALVDCENIEDPSYADAFGEAITAARAVLAERETPRNED